MKKYLFLLLCTISLALTAGAQVKPPVKPKAERKIVAVKQKPTPTASATLQNSVTPSVNDKRKKDGSLDMRYKANKEKAVPVKKDGTPDMRFKKNKKN